MNIDELDKKIDQFYSYKQAYDSGWRNVTNKEFVEPPATSAWVCPSCMKGYYKIKTNN